eukprot:Skav214550  [mRNA]  locus=scaffold410:796296:799952:+ [translate_table: standard]
MFPAPTQLLPEVGNGTDGLSVLESLGKALAGCIPKPECKLVTTPETWNHRLYRASTRNLLLGVANALIQIMPEGWKMNQCVPGNILKPAGSRTRCSLLQQEISILSQSKLDLMNRKLFFVWCEDGDKVFRELDFYADPRAFYRLCFAGDEGTEVSCVQKSADASLQFAIGLASGIRVTKLIAKTVSECVSVQALQWIGAMGPDCNCSELLEFHSDLLLSHLGSLVEVNTHHSTFPWRMVLALTASNLHDLLTSMKKEWQFVTEHVDTTDPKSILHKLLSWTRSQPYRECMTVAESLDFNAQRAQKDPYFMGVAKAVCGISHDLHGSLLTSVPVELVFNDIRDAAKRHTKAQVTSGCNIHSIVARSCEHRSPAVKSLNPSASDWSLQLAGKNVKQNVFDPSRCTDKMLGVSMVGLTKRKSEYEMTKPHIFSQRLELLGILKGLWRNKQDNFDIETEFRKLWLAGLAERGLLLQLASCGDNVLIVLKGGPYSMRCMWLRETKDECDQTVFTFPEKLDEISICQLPILKVETYKVCLSKPSVDLKSGRLAWRRDSDWMLLTEYVAHHSIARLSASTVTSLCSLLKLKGFSKMNHHKKVELYLRHFEIPDARIKEILESIPVRPTRKKKEAETAEEERGPPCLETRLSIERVYESYRNRFEIFRCSQHFFPGGQS